MANVLTDLAADLYTGAQNVGREQTGFIPASTMNMEAATAAKGDTVRAAFAPSVTAADVTPAMTIPEGTDQTIANKTMTLSKFKSVPIPYTNEDVRHLNNGAGYETVLGKQIEQAMRSLANQIEYDIAVAATANCSGAYGTAATTPFGTANDYTDASNVLKLLKDEGASQFDNQLVINTAAGANFLGKQSAVNAAGTDSILRQGVLLDIAGMPIRESAQVQDHTAGTAASATTDTAGYAIGATSITLAAAGTGTILAGDVITFAGDSTKYVVATGVGAVSGGTITLVGGLKKAIPASATAITMIASSARNIAFSKPAIEFAMRASDGDDAAVDMMTVQDPVSGLVFAVKEYRGYNKKMIDISALWGVKVWQPEFVKALLG